ncbi:hypothetical protein [Ligilactobacillus salivarius]|uniref:hypothetical protein n=1 Tax=Ligilactobacillus salivarius TaxID=1624 RepID=UPI001651D5C9|nr:hypothetical protein [Ligilactobacillus salivarius]MBC6925087.1 hypothetical protein [Ligilactobacillus salivarius]
MHTLLGYSWAEIASIVAILSVLFSGIYWLINHGSKAFNKNINSVLKPFYEQLQALIVNIQKLNASFDKQQVNVERLEKRVDEHDRRLDRHHERIKSLFERKENE